MNVEGSDATITLTLNRRFLVISAILLLAVITFTLAIFAAPRVFALSSLSSTLPVSGGSINGTQFTAQPFAQTSDCPPQTTQISQVFSALVQTLTGAGASNTTGTTDTSASEAFTLRGISTSRNINSAGCTAEGDITDQFAPMDRVYIVAENSDFPAGTAIFARLSLEGRAVEDTSEIVADREYLNTCVNLWFESSSGFEAGEYTIDLFINGISAAQVTFTVK